MITKQTHTTVYVTDQDRAKEFYTEKLGFEVRDDARMGSFRWLTVSPKTQPDLRIVLYALTPSQWLTEEHVSMLRKLVEGGVIGAGVLECDDIRREYQELSAKGVKFKSEPKEMPYGIEAVFQDDSGNFWSLGQKSR
jgi:catechol 2,3-dioxygenase-like lactoylglutathione lyase family enzyme